MNLACKYLAIFCVNILCYYQSLSGGFVFDDSVAIVKNKDVHKGINSNTLQVGFLNENCNLEPSNCIDLAIKSHLSITFTFRTSSATIFGEIT